MLGQLLRAGLECLCLGVVRDALDDLAGDRDRRIAQGERLLGDVGQGHRLADQALLLELVEEGDDLAGALDQLEDRVGQRRLHMARVEDHLEDVDLGHLAGLVHELVDLVEALGGLLEPALQEGLVGGDEVGRFERRVVRFGVDAALEELRPEAREFLPERADVEFDERRDPLEHVLVVALDRLPDRQRGAGRAWGFGARIDERGPQVLEQVPVTLGQVRPELDRAKLAPLPRVRLGDVRGEDGVALVDHLFLDHAEQLLGPGDEIHVVVAVLCLAGTPGCGAHVLLADERHVVGVGREVFGGHAQLPASN